MSLARECHHEERCRSHERDGEDHLAPLEKPTDAKGSTHAQKKERISATNSDKSFILRKVLSGPC